MEILDIKLEQLPIIKYDAIDEIANQVAIKMNELKLDELEVNEDNFKEVKKVRTELKKEFEEYENKRKLIKDMVMKPYNDFEDKYKKISTYYKGADDKLKTKINEVESTLLDNKINKLKESFNEINEWDWVSFEDLELKITRSTSDKEIIDKVNEFMTKTRNDLATIDTLENKDRILAKYQITKDLNVSISQTNIEIEREKLIAEKETKINDNVEVKDEIIAKTEIKEHQDLQEEMTYETTFKVKGTLQQLKELKQFMNERGIAYE